MNALWIEIRSKDRAQRLAREAEAAEANQRAESLDGAQDALDFAGDVIDDMGRTIATLRILAFCGWVSAVVATMAAIANLQHP